MKTRKFTNIDKLVEVMSFALERYYSDAISDIVKRAFALKRLRDCPHCGNCSVKHC